VKINQLIKERNKKLNESGVLFILLIIGALMIDNLESSLVNSIISVVIKIASLYGLILLSRRMRAPIQCPCCNADLSFDAYAKSKAKIKTCPFCHIRFDQDSVPYKRRLAEIRHERGIVDEEFFDDV
jgi:Zn finger protein HypA/HybF involved in hydrogenase expression